jgi:hypothetical protein
MTRRQILATARVPSPLEAEAHAFYARFADMSAQEFGGSLRGKDFLVTWREAGALRGMMVVQISRERRPDSGREVLLLSTHHAAMEPSLRGRNLLQMACLRLYLGLRARHPLTPIYWLFDTYSYKSYLAMTRTFARCWPRPGAPLPAVEAALVDRLMARAHPDIWMKERGVLAWRARALRPGVADVDAAALDDPDVRFFAQANPGHARGDCLVCLCPLDARNLAGAALRRLVLRSRTP